MILAGDGNNIVWSGSGSDAVVTGAGEDRINAGFGDDLVIAGAGRDRVLGGFERDLLIAGPALNEDDTNALDVALASWQTDDLSAALASLTEIEDDEEKDRLFGGFGWDELVGGTGDRLFA